MDDAMREEILKEVLQWDGVPRREEGDFTLGEYQELHRRTYGYPLPDTTARDRLDRRVEEGRLDTAFRYDSVEEEKRRVWWVRGQSDLESGF